LQSSLNGTARDPRDLRYRRQPAQPAARVSLAAAAIIAAEWTTDTRTAMPRLASTKDKNIGYVAEYLTALPSSIMQAMLDGVAPKLKIGARMLSETVRADAREGDIGIGSRVLGRTHPISPAKKGALYRDR
jgi:hypothetical protein